ncbi:hypothetical protein CLV35_3959 [Motilibacter peucedani]|uniref:DUF1772 domain-containing protein n=1 Tax=Motilibacter peucedani TaxID=598650 RepID=A0A420XJZ8_9ACTN|nr:hypothetical protein [Motilibacter peucedani]RKS68052.1 hypothetical protein CLV35_3959 [Motilibacter peucedani]
MDASTALLAASALHLGFQSVVTLVVYPALADVPPGAWAAAHNAHSRRTTVVVAPVYVLLAASCAWLLAAGPRGGWELLACAGAALAALTTAFVAAPLHGRLGRAGPAPRTLRRLLRADRVRLAGALVAAAGALVARC